jgi:cell division protein FtsB
MIPLKIADMAVAACNEEIAKLLAENARLKGEVERLNTGIQPEGSNDAVGRAVNVLLEKEKEIARLKAELERLTEKVRKIAEQVTKERKSAEEWHGRMTDDYNNPNGSAMGQDVVEASASLQSWEKAEELLKDFAAKEGKQS